MIAIALLGASVWDSKSFGSTAFDVTGDELRITTKQRRIEAITFDTKDFKYSEEKFSYDPDSSSYSMPLEENLKKTLELGQPQIHISYQKKRHKDRFYPDGAMYSFTSTGNRDEIFIKGLEIIDDGWQFESNTLIPYGGFYYGQNNQYFSFFYKEFCDRITHKNKALLKAIKAASKEHGVIQATASLKKHVEDDRNRWTYVYTIQDSNLFSEFNLEDLGHIHFSWICDPRTEVPRGEKKVWFNKNLREKINFERSLLRISSGSHQNPSFGQAMNRVLVPFLKNDMKRDRPASLEREEESFQGMHRQPILRHVENLSHIEREEGEISEEEIQYVGKQARDTLNNVKEFSVKNFYKDPRAVYERWKSFVDSKDYKELSEEDQIFSLYRKAYIADDAFSREKNREKREIWFDVIQDQKLLNLLSKKQIIRALHQYAWFSEHTLPRTQEGDLERHENWSKVCQPGDFGFRSEFEFLSEKAQLMALFSRGRSSDFAKRDPEKTIALYNEFLELLSRKPHLKENFCKQEKETEENIEYVKKRMKNNISLFS